MQTAIWLFWKYWKDQYPDIVEAPSHVSDAMKLGSDAELESQLQSGAQPKRYEDMGIPSGPTQVGLSGSGLPSITTGKDDPC